MRLLNEGEQRVLTYMLKKKKATVREIVFGVAGSPNTILKNINSLVEMGLLAEKRENRFPFRRVLTLTAKGEQVAKHLTKAYEVMK